MGKKPKFNPTITRVKLNPEQAVLQTACFNYGYIVNWMNYNSYGVWGYICDRYSRYAYWYSPNHWCTWSSPGS